ncbi:putative metal-dependent hydrolase [Polychaeton citri CBS 116435]|uniref:Metal-dependent hydrolase n=1 Tax=Polychaeton citri CBS 116435 TaxID=1314669 RepID=A0A9P4US21_9PEZI|nr:putative metal-dependent hydrolase [Polychaeton citri CBS 116435]
MTPPLITLEEHYISPHIQDELKALGKRDPYAGFPPAALNQLYDLGEGRVRDLDAGGIQLQVISHSAIDGSPEAVRAANDHLAAACNKHPDRLAAFAKLPMEDPAAAAEELARCVRQHHFLGALINNHSNGVFYDDERFLPVFSCAEELDVPLYLHPTFAADDAMPHYKGNFSEMAAISMSAWGWGWHSETALHFLRLWASGLFDKHPKLKIVLGHMGEMLPYQLDRIIAGSARWCSAKRDLRTVWKENVWVTMSGMFSQAPLACLLKACSIDRIMYSVDYPQSKNEAGLAFIKEIEKEGILSEEDLDAVCWANAEKLLKIKAIHN